MLPSCRDHHLGNVTQALFSPISHFCRYYWFPQLFSSLSQQDTLKTEFFLFLCCGLFSTILYIALVFANLIESVATKAAFSFNSSPQMVRLRRLTSTTHLLWIMYYHMLNLNLKSDIPEVTFSKLPKTYLLGKWGRCRVLFVSKMILTPDKKLYEWVWTSLAVDWMRCLCIHIISLHNLCSLWGVSLWHRWVDDWRGRAGIDWWVWWEKPELGNYGLSREGSNL